MGQEVEEVAKLKEKVVEQEGHLKMRIKLSWQEWKKSWDQWKNAFSETRISWDMNGRKHGKARVIRKRSNYLRRKRSCSRMQKGQVRRDKAERTWNEWSQIWEKMSAKARKKMLATQEEVTLEEEPPQNGKNHLRSGKKKQKQQQQQQQKKKHQ